MRRLTIATIVAVLAVSTVALPTGASERDGRWRGHDQPAGAVSVTSEFSFEETWSNLIGALEANPNITIVTEIDHAAAAAGVGLDLEPNRVVVFGNPNLGTPLMQANQTVGLDLPQKMHVFERDGVVTVAYNSPDYLVDRHDLGAPATIDTIGGALASFAEAASGVAPDTSNIGPRWYRYLDGLRTVTSDADFDTTWGRLEAAIEASPASVAVTVDHGANAAANGLDLRPTRLVVFGNPNLGTPLMQVSPSAGIDLPLKILVWEDETGAVNVTTNRTYFTVLRHRIFDGNSTFETLRTINGAVGGFIDAATGG